MILCHQTAGTEMLEIWRHSGKKGALFASPLLVGRKIGVSAPQNAVNRSIQAVRLRSPHNRTPSPALKQLEHAIYSFPNIA